MSRTKFTKILKILICGASLSLLLIYFWALPKFGHLLSSAYPEFAHRYTPWLIFLWLTAIPCFGALWFAWKIAVNIGNDHPFTMENAEALQKIARFAAVDSLFLIAGNILFLFLNLNHPSVLLCSIGISLVGGVVWLIGTELSELTARAAALQEQSDLTI